MIVLRGLTKEFSNRRGIFDLNFTVSEGLRLWKKIRCGDVETGCVHRTKLLLEIWGIEQVYARGFATEEWNFQFPPESYNTCGVEELLAFGRSVREETRRLWPAVTTEALSKQRPTPFPGHPEGRAIEWLTYALENEIHHRGQGYVYLRLLGIAPPEFNARHE